MGNVNALVLDNHYSNSYGSTLCSYFLFRNAIWSDLFFALLVPLLPAIKDDLGLSYAEVGLLRSVFTGATAVFQIPVGILAETTGEFWLLLLGNAWVSIGLMAMALCTVFPLLLVVSFVGGLGGGLNTHSVLVWCPGV
ncbi:MAG: hypothetical protein CM1200mP15_01520 [Dehalococcoidia bacterium]|nr:MAG: hypothetical protein CM1200mP15_01520 [Dehalococcoidia bacterium]